MRSTIRFFLVLITVIVILFAWITKQLNETRIQILIILLVGVSFAAFFLMNLLDRREQKKQREKRESTIKNGIRHEENSLAGEGDRKRSDGTFALRERKSGLTWGGGNIKASEAKRGTKRKFLGK